MTHIYRTDHRTDGPSRSGPISVLLKISPRTGPRTGPRSKWSGPDR